MEKIITSESVFRGHPDKVCDQISDVILDECLKQDKNSRVAIETAIKQHQVYLLGEITTKANLDYDKIVREKLNEIGYKSSFEIIKNITIQSPDIAKGVDLDGAGDQGIVYGYATDETEEMLPLPYILARKISVQMEEVRHMYPELLAPDGKCQVSVLYRNNKAIKVTTIVISTQTKKEIDLNVLKELIISECISKVIDTNFYKDAQILINPTGIFLVGGPDADSGLTGRKLMVDTYGGLAHHGGGAFSGKDPSKVDRSGAYYARYVARAIVTANLAKRCEVSVAYCIGKSEPVSINIEFFGTNKVNARKIYNAVLKTFDFTPKNMIEELKLKDITSYSTLASYGHFSNNKYPWEYLNNNIINKLLSNIK